MASRESSHATASPPEYGSGSVGRSALCARNCANCARPISVDERGESSGSLPLPASTPLTKRSHSPKRFATLAHPRHANATHVDHHDGVSRPTVLELAFQEFP